MSPREQESSLKTSDLYRSVTERIVQELEQGAAPWLKPWKSKAVGSLMPQNAVTGHGYRGINIPILWDAAERNGYPQHLWLTYKQAQAADAQVRKGEHGTQIVFTRRITVEREDADDRRISMLRAYTVFNVAQVDGLKMPDPAEIVREPPEDATKRFIEATKADVRYGAGEAMYVPSRDFITMPPFSSFKAPAGYYATGLHELGHWSGAKSRLDRDLTGRFGTRSYAAEELIAELNAAFLCAHLGIQGELRHAGYIKSWIELLKHDDRAIFTAASKASQAADYLRSFSETIEMDGAS